MTARRGSGSDGSHRARRRCGPAAIAVAGLLSVASPASAAATAWVGDAHAAVRLVSAAEGRGAGKLEVGLAFRFAPGWHSYWRTPGDAGIPPSIDWAGTPDLEGADLAWPVPSRLVVSGLQNAVFDRTVLLPARLAFRGGPSGPTALRAAVDYAACSDVCVPYHADLALDLPAGAEEPAPEAPLIAAARAAVPGDPAGAGFRVRRDEIVGSGADRRLVPELARWAGPLVHPDLFVEGYGEGLPPAPAVTVADGGTAATLSVPLPAGADGGPGPGGPLRLTVVEGPRAATFLGPELVPIPAGPNARPMDFAAIPDDLFAAMFSALLGGLSST